MGDSYVQIYLQIVFSTKRRQHFFGQVEADKLGKILCKILQDNGHTPLAIKCLPDHAHLFVRMNKVQSISKLVANVKANSSRWVNEQVWSRSKFNWQTGYAAFSYSHSHVDAVKRYVHNQEEHHRQQDFKKELVSILESRQIRFDNRYLFESGENENP